MFIDTGWIMLGSFESNQNLGPCDCGEFSFTACGWVQDHGSPYIAETLKFVCTVDWMKNFVLNMESLLISMSLAEENTGFNFTLV